MAKPLTRRQLRFIAEYVACLNAAQSARAAGYSDGPNGDAAKVAGHRLLRDPRIAAAIDEAIAETAGPLRVRVIDELGIVAFAAVGDDGGVRMNDKLRALEMLGKVVALFDDRNAMAEIQKEVDRIGQLIDARNAGAAAVADLDAVEAEIAKLKAERPVSGGMLQ